MPADMGGVGAGVGGELRGGVRAECRGRLHSDNPEDEEDNSKWRGRWSDEEQLQSRGAREGDSHRSQLHLQEEEAPLPSQI